MTLALDHQVSMCREFVESVGIIAEHPVTKGATHWPLPEDSADDLRDALAPVMADASKLSTDWLDWAMSSWALLGAVEMCDGKMEDLLWICYVARQVAVVIGHGCPEQWDYASYRIATDDRQGAFGFRRMLCLTN